MAKLFKNHDFKIDITISVLRYYVFPVILYGVKFWTLTEQQSKDLKYNGENFEMNRSGAYCKM